MSKWKTISEQVNGAFQFETERGRFMAIVLIPRQLNQWRVQAWSKNGEPQRSYGIEDSPGYDTAVEALSAAGRLLRQWGGN
jgi:hypothetical protein